MNSLLGTVRRADIILRANGQFDLTARIVRLLDLNPADVVDVLRDGREFYLYVARRDLDASSGRFEAQVFPSAGHAHSRAHHYRGYSVRLCRALISAAGRSGRAALPCGEPIVDSIGRRLIPIIVRLNIDHSHDQ